MEKQTSIAKENEPPRYTAQAGPHCSMCRKTITEADKPSFFTEGLCEHCATIDAWGD